MHGKVLLSTSMWTTPLPGQHPAGHQGPGHRDKGSVQEAESEPQQLLGR